MVSVVIQPAPCTYPLHEPAATPKILGNTYLAVCCICSCLRAGEVLNLDSLHAESATLVLCCLNLMQPKLKGETSIHLINGVLMASKELDVHASGNSTSSCWAVTSSSTSTSPVSDRMQFIHFQVSTHCTEHEGCCPALHS